MNEQRALLARRGLRSSVYFLFFCPPAPPDSTCASSAKKGRAPTVHEGAERSRPDCLAGKSDGGRAPSRLGRSGCMQRSQRLARACSSLVSSCCLCCRHAAAAAANANANANANRGAAAPGEAEQRRAVKPGVGRRRSDRCGAVLLNPSAACCEARRGQ